MPVLAISELLNPVDAKPSTSSTGSHAPDSLPSDVTPFKIEHNVRINQRTLASTVYHHKSKDVIEYPETTPNSLTSIAYILHMESTDKPYNPARNFAYSAGKPSGQSKGHFTKVLLDRDGQPVLCLVDYSTCRGIHVCPFVSPHIKETSHTRASRAALQLQLDQAHRDRPDFTPEEEVLNKTIAWFRFITDNGCGYNLQEATLYSEKERFVKAEIQLTPTKAKCGQKTKQTCQGRIVIRQMLDKQYICCEHYSHTSHKHFVLYPDRGGGYNFEYLCALLWNDKSAIKNIELGAYKNGYGPLASCTTVRNFGSQKVNCENGHRKSSKETMLMTEMVHQPCSTRFTVIRPEDGYWEACPKILLLCHSPHTHPIPFPTTMPVHIKSEIKVLIRSLEHELADMIPRRFCRHPAVVNRVKQLCPDEEEPTLTHIHPSLANLDHIASYIHTEIKACLPKGTGWDGVLHMKSKQDEEGSTPYIREMKQISWQRLKDGGDDSEDEDGPLEGLDDDCFKLISDISFKRVPGWKEFELVSVDHETSQEKSFQLAVVVICRAFMNSQSTHAHQLLFVTIRSVVHQDTQRDVEYRHLHSSSLDDHRGILHWAADQDRGQVKGLGFHLQDVARELAYDRKDLHETGHSVVSGMYSTSHPVESRVQGSKITAVKDKMHSLVCIRHPNWHDTIAYIEREGGVSGRNWIYNKIHSKFAIQGMCWERSFIPLSIWQAGDATTNAVEMSHIDIYQEGMPCSLVGGISRARYYDKMRLQTHRVAQKTGVKAAYRPTTTVVSVVRKYKQTVIQRTRKFNMADRHINEQNERLQKSWERYQNTVRKLAAKPSDLKAIESHEKQKQAYEKQKQKSLDMEKRLRGQSSGRVKLVFPA
ncbi:hypothetical protein EV421DRAFT_1914379 [Armillaria borealis]|uniref:Uncharacterized protein n=1 Tax=Armillaria borealis TaxID=47425 RepID=A0AA39ISD2_9AGAR|nr:hypothetical protein EV421DRAFT_1914379 [Armillaria borealis]